jgi:pimeloyl-ACP methyl ester carboxylesterase
MWATGLSNRCVTFERTRRSFRSSGISCRTSRLRRRSFHGAQDRAVRPVNGEFLHERLPKSKLDVIDAGHFTWEDAPDEYAQILSTWWGGGYRAVE